MLVEAAAIVARSDPGAGFIHFGDGPLRETIRRRIEELGLERRFILAGLRDDLDRFLPHWDLSVLPSYTEGLPTVVLESYAAGVPVVATAVGGTPEAVADGVDGYLVPPGDPVALAGRIRDVLGADEERSLTWACWAPANRERSSRSTPRPFASVWSARTSSRHAAGIRLVVRPPSIFGRLTSLRAQPDCRSGVSPWGLTRARPRPRRSPMVTMK